MNRTIIHLNIADFAVAVERTLDRQLREWPVIIAPLGAPRAAVYDMSDEAYQAGVYKGMPLDAARRACREARLQNPRFGRYAQAMAALLQRVRPLTPLIEPGTDDGHLFMDVSGTERLHGPPQDVAGRRRSTKPCKASIRNRWPLWARRPRKWAAPTLLPRTATIVGRSGRWSIS